MKRVAILCNGQSSKVIARKELIKQLQNEGYQVYVGEVFDGVINEYYASNNIIFLPIIASRNNTNPFKEIKSIFNIRKQIRNHKIDCVIIYGVKNHAAMAIGSKIGGAKKIICIVNGSGNLFRVTGLKGKILRFMSFPMLKIAYSLCSSICFQNSDDLELFKNKKLISKRKDIFVTGGSGVNLDDYPYSLLPKKDRFLFLARITPTKGIKEYIEAAYELKKKYPNCEFDIFGNIDSTIENSIGDIIDRAVMAGVVNYHGKTADAAKAIKDCRYFIYPSYYPEGVSRCLLQALSSGRPIITCNTPGCKETVIDGVNGFLVEKQNVKELVKKMEFFLEHKDKISKFGKESRRLAEEKFDVNYVNSILINKLK